MAHLLQSVTPGKGVKPNILVVRFGDIGSLDLLTEDHNGFPIVIAVAGFDLKVVEVMEVVIEALSVFHVFRFLRIVL
jgi:hypothetical protein